MPLISTSPRVASRLAGQPWAERCNPVGIEGPAITLLAVSQITPPMITAAAAGAAPSSGADNGAGTGRRGSLQSWRRAGTKTFKTRKTTITVNNAGAPFGNRKAAQPISVQPNAKETLLSERFSVNGR